MTNANGDASRSSREDIYRERYGHLDVPEESVRCIVESFVQREDELLWAFYRNLDVTQAEAIELSGAGDTIGGVSQSTASRIISDVDGRVPFEELSHSLAPFSGYGEDEPRDEIPDEVLEAMRDVVARTLVELEALRNLSGGDEPPAWVRARFPEVAAAVAPNNNRGKHSPVADD